jgi:hypothetical protein
MESGKDIPDATREMMGWVEHLVAVPFTSFGNFELILNYLYLNEIF